MSADENAERHGRAMRRRFCPIVWDPARKPQVLSRGIGTADPRRYQWLAACARAGWREAFWGELEFSICSDDDAGFHIAAPVDRGNQLPREGQDREVRRRAYRPALLSPMVIPLTNYDKSVIN